MLTGDFSTMAFADVLQWLDATRANGVLSVERTSESLWMEVRGRTTIRASAPPAQPIPLAALGGAPLSIDVGELASDLAVEHLFDQFLDSEGRFRFEPNVHETAGISLDLPLIELLMESLRLLDEWPSLDARYPGDIGRLSWIGPDPARPTRLQAAVIECAKRGLGAEEVRFALGLSRPALLRRLHELSSMGCIAVGGSPATEGTAARLIAQARALLHEKQFDEASHVFSALLASDPSASSVRHLLRGAEEQQLEWLRAEVPAAAVPRRVSKAGETGLLTQTDREILSRINGWWDVAVLSLVSPFRETETLKSLRKLTRLRFIELGRR